MKLNQTVKTFLSTALVSITCTGFITAAATSAQARDNEERPHRPVMTAQRVERLPVPQAPEPAPPPAPKPAPKPAPRLPQPNNHQNDRPSGVSLNVEVQI